MLLLLTALLSTTLVTGGCDAGQTEIAIENEGNTDLQSAVVYVTGRTYHLGEIKAGQSRTLKVSVEGESHIEIGHSRAEERLVLDVYLEPGYGGRVEAKITSDSVRSVRYQRGY